MTNLLAISAQPDVPIACDMTTADDTLTDRLGEWRRLFEHALLARESTGTSTTFRLADRAGVREWVLDLARREAACCPFLSFQVDADGDQVVWTITGISDTDMAVLDEFLAEAIPDDLDSRELAERLTQRSGVPHVVPD